MKMPRHLLAALALFALVIQASGQGYNSFQSTTFTAPGVGAPIPQQSLIKFHQLIWTTTGSPATCTVALDSSPDGITWTPGGVLASQVCTTTGNSIIVNI